MSNRKTIILSLLVLLQGLWPAVHVQAGIKPFVSYADTGLLQLSQHVLKAAIISKADHALLEQPVTVTASRSNRSAGGLHDFFSEGDYWWPNPKHMDSPYIQRDGQTNPDNFVAHRQAMVRFSDIVGSLAAAFQLTGKTVYAQHALKHCRAWFIDTSTRMNPHLLYAQAIKGRVTGRGIGIIDAIHLMEVVKGLELIEASGKISEPQVLNGSREWFRQYLQWVTTHSYGLDEMKAANNHGTCWVMQVAVFANFTKNDSLLVMCRNRYKQVLLPTQMAADGSFPLELKRTKPYGYSIFNLDAMATICQELSTPDDNLWHYQTPDGRSIRKGMEYLYPFVRDKTRWTLSPDVMYWNEWPVAQPFLLFGAMAFNQSDWWRTWQQLEHFPQNEEVIRNLPVRNPLIWYQKY
jgi:hypothetical protein